MRRPLLAGIYVILGLTLIPILEGCPATITNSPTLPAGPTAPTAFTGITFNTPSSVSGWTTFNGSGLTSSLIYNPTFSSCTGTTGAMEVTVGFTAPSQSVIYVDTFSPPGILSGRGVTSVLEVTSGWNSDAEQLSAAFYLLTPFPASHSGTVSLGAFIGNPISLNNPASTATNSGCVTLSLTMPVSAVATGTYSNYTVVNGPFDPSSVGGIGLLVLDGAIGGAYGPTVIDIKNWL